MTTTTLRRVRFVVLASVALVGSGCRGGGDPDATELGKDAIRWCLDVPTNQEPEVSTLPRVDCDKAHTHEIFGVFESEHDTYPGFDALETEAQVGCLDLFEEYVGVSPFDSTLFYSWMVPSLTSWSDADLENSSDEPGDREIICVVGLPGDAEIPAGTVLYRSNR